MRFSPVIRPDARLNRVNRRQAERIIAEILKPVRFQKAQQSATLKKYDPNELAINTPKCVGERTAWTWVFNSEFWRHG
jgi:hypothetical protein